MALHKELGEGLIKLNNQLGDVEGGVEELKAQGSGWFTSSLITTKLDIR